MTCSKIYNLCSETYRSKGYQISNRCISFVTLSTVAAFALFLIGCIAAASAFHASPKTLGYLVIGLSGAFFLADLSIGNFKVRKMALSINSLLIVGLISVGILGCTGMLTTKQVGYSILGGVLGSCLFISLCDAYSSRKKSQTT